VLREVIRGELEEIKEKYGMRVELASWKEKRRKTKRGNRAISRRRYSDTLTRDGYIKEPLWILIASKEEEAKESRVL
jgi:hypothetical protein